MANLFSATSRPGATARLTAGLLAGGYVTVAALSAQAAQDVSRVAPAFGNTVVSTFPDGRHQKIWLHADGTWDGIGRNGYALSGRWRLKDSDKVCLKQSRPPTLPVSLCVNFPAYGQIGSVWKSRDFVGHPIQLTLQRGAPPEMGTVGSR
jgi:hypothetical protein